MICCRKTMDGMNGNISDAPVTNPSTLPAISTLNPVQVIYLITPLICLPIPIQIIQTADVELCRTDFFTNEHYLHFVVRLHNLQILNVCFVHIIVFST